MDPIIVYRNRTVVVPVSLGFDASDDVFTSDIRVDDDPESELIASWEVESNTVDGLTELTLTLDNSVTAAITKFTGYMDIKRMTGGEPVSVFDHPLEVLFRNPVTS